MNIILFEKDELADRAILLTDHRAKHIVKVLQSREGDILRVGMLDGQIGEATVVSVKRKFPFAVELHVTLKEHPVPPPAIDLLLALPRPIMLKRILSQVTALGVDTIHLLNASRVEKSFWEAGILDEEEYRPHLIHGLEQAIDTRLPKVRIHKRFRPFVEDILPDLAPQYANLLLAHPLTKETLSSCLSGSDGRILFAVGPEGGWVDFEVDKFLSTGMQPFSLGNRILKVDTAVVAIHAMIRQELDSSSSHT